MEMGRRNTFASTVNSGPPPYNPPNRPSSRNRCKYSWVEVNPSCRVADCNKSRAVTTTILGVLRSDKDEDDDDDEDEDDADDLFFVFVDDDDDDDEVVDDEIYKVPLGDSKIWATTSRVSREMARNNKSLAPSPMDVAAAKATAKNMQSPSPGTFLIVK